MPGSARHLRHPLTSWVDDAGLSEMIAHVGGMPNGKGGHGRAEMGISYCAHGRRRWLQGMDGLGWAGEGAAASRGAGRVSIASDGRNSVDERTA